MADSNVLKSKISTFDAVIMVAFAVLADIFNMIPGLNFIVSAISLVGYQLAFWLRGVDKTGYNIAGNLMEVVPFLSTLPATTAGVMMTIHFQWKKEAIERKELEEKAKAEKIRSANQQIENFKKQAQAAQAMSAAADYSRPQNIDVRPPSSQARPSNRNPLPQNVGRPKSDSAQRVA